MDQIVDYGTLKAAVTAYLHRTDQADNVPVFISMGISKINRECKSRHQEQVSTLTVPAGTSLIALPAGYKAMRSVTADGAPLRQLSLDQYNRRYNHTSGTPTSYIVADNRLTIHPAPDADVELRMTFFDTILPFTGDTDTHNLLVANPNIFVYAAMREAVPFLEGDDRMMLWVKLLEQEIAIENSSSEEARWSGSPLQIEGNYTYTP